MYLIRPNHNVKYRNHGGVPLRHDILELTLLGAGNVQTIHIKRGTLEVGPGCLSYVPFEDENGSRTYVPLHRVERFRYSDHSRTNQ